MFEQINVSASYFEFSSVGRLFVSLAKLEKPTRWERLLTNTSKPYKNMHVWWDMQQKYQKELSKHKKFEDDEELNIKDAVKSTREREKELFENLRKNPPPKVSYPNSLLIRKI